MCLYCGWSIKRGSTAANNNNRVLAVAIYMYCFELTNRFLYVCTCISIHFLYICMKFHYSTMIHVYT